MLLFLIESGGLGAITAIFHIAPTAASVAADINKKPTACRIDTCFDFLHFIGNQGLGRRTDNGVQYPVQSGPASGNIPGVTS